MTISINDMIIAGRTFNDLSGEELIELKKALVITDPFYEAVVGACYRRLNPPPVKGECPSCGAPIYEKNLL